MSCSVTRIQPGSAGVHSRAKAPRRGTFRRTLQRAFGQLRHRRRGFGRHRQGQVRRRSHRYCAQRPVGAGRRRSGPMVAGLGSHAGDYRVRRTGHVGQPRRRSGTGGSAGRAGSAEPGQRRRGAAAAARTVRRRRHVAGAAGDGRRALRGRRRAGLGGRHGQTLHEGGLRIGGPRRGPLRGDHRPPVAAGRRSCRSSGRHRFSSRSSSSPPAPDPRWALPAWPTHPGLRSAIEAAREHDPKVVVEAGIIGREIEVAVLQGARHRTDPRQPARRDCGTARRTPVLRLRGEIH